MTDRGKIEKTIQTYFDSMHESSAEKVFTAFHKDAWITGYMPDGYLHVTVAEFADVVASQQPSPKSNGDPAVLEILSVEIAGRTAVARIRDAYLGLMFLDILSFINHEGEWRIINKLFHVES